MIKAMGAVLMSVLLLIFLSGCGQGEQPAKPEHPKATEQTKPEAQKAEPAKPEHPQAEPAKPEQPKSENPK